MEDLGKKSTSPTVANERVLHVTNPNNDDNTTLDIYEKWAGQYEADTGKLTYSCPQLVTSLMKQLIPDRQVKVLDIGAGTGWLGRLMKKEGYEHIDAVDPSPAMLKNAFEDKIYERTIIDFVGANRLDIPDNTYDVITGSGVFVPGHVKGDAFPELTRITKKGGLLLIVCSERYYEKRFDSYGDDLDQSMEECLQQGLWKQEVRQLVPGYLGDYKAHVSLMRKL